MNLQIQKASYFIETHLDSEFDVIALAKIAGYSHFHFCRVFKLNVGESVISYATRLRLERASAELSYSDKNILEVALDAGYRTPTGFLKAFKKKFGTTPTEYKSSSKKSHKKYKDIDMNTPEVVEREKTAVIFTRELGDYTKSSEIAWNRLSGMLHGLGEKFAKNPPKVEINLTPGEGEALGLCHDDPKTTNEEHIRYDAALAWGDKETKVLAEYDFQIKTVAGGRYAKVLYEGVSNGEESWYGLYAWIEKNGHTFRDEPAFEKYLNGATETDMSKILVEIFVPID